MSKKKRDRNPQGQLKGGGAKQWNLLGEYAAFHPDEVAVESRTYVKGCVSSDTSPERGASASRIFGSSYYKGHMIAKSPEAAVNSYRDMINDD